MLIIVIIIIRKVTTRSAICWRKQKDTVSVTSILGGASDNTGSGIARRLGKFWIIFDVFCDYIRIIGACSDMPYFSVLKTGLNIILACNIPKNSPMLEVSSLFLSLFSLYLSLSEWHRHAQPYTRDNHCCYAGFSVNLFLGKLYFFTSNLGKFLFGPWTF